MGGARTVRGGGIGRDPACDAAAADAVMGGAGAPRSAATEAERAARSSYGRLLAILAARTRDIAGAEDALADAFAAALTQWPRDGVPANPTGWLMVAARRSAGHSAGRRRTASAGETMVTLLAEERGESSLGAFGDRRLELMFACTHPTIAADAQAPLMLQAILGLDAARIAASFLVSTASMSQRLVRAKRKIRDAGIPFAVPDMEQLPGRSASLLSAIYAAYGSAWEDVTGADGKLAGLAAEAIWLAKLLDELLPGDPEAMGLRALMLHCEARRAARRDPSGAFVPLHRQDIGLWSGAMMSEAEALLRAASLCNAPGRFQTEAAIQSLHAHQRVSGLRFTGALAQLYDVLAHFAPTAGVLVARAAAHAEDGRAEAALRQLDAIPNIAAYQPWWAARARICWLLGDESAAGQAAERAAGLSSDASVRKFLLAGGFREPR